jgi:glycosyltransferase involved in cell wall biosynthesis
VRILMLCYEFPPIGGGGSKVVDGLTRELARSGHEIDLVTTRFGDSPSREQRGNLTIWRVPCWRRRLDRSNALELASYIVACMFRAMSLVRRQRYDVCHTHFIFPDGIIAWLLNLLRGQHFVITAHGSDVPGYNSYRFVGMHRILFPLWRMISRRADCIVAPSDYLQTLLKQTEDHCNVETIPNGFDPARFSTVSARKNIILCVTRLFERKGVQYLIQAVSELDVPFELHIVGDGPYRQSLETLARSSRMPVRFHGWLDNDSPEIAELFATSRIFVLASEAENFPVSLLEAMSASLAIITCAGTGSADVVGDTGILVPVGDPEALRRAIESLCKNQDKCLELGKRARKRLVDTFSWQSVAQRYAELYRWYPAWPGAGSRQQIRGGW